MLNYECRKLLKIINKLNSQNDKISRWNIIKSYPAKKQAKIALKLFEILEYLKTNDYLTYLCADDDIYDISLTYKGLAYSSFRFEEWKDFLFKSVTVPILVSLITAILTTYILQWLQELL